MMQVNSELPGDLTRVSGHTNADVIAALVLYLESARGWVTFDDIRENVAELEGVEPGYIHQACFDAGYTEVQ